VTLQHKLQTGVKSSIHSTVLGLQDSDALSLEMICSGIQEYMVSEARGQGFSHLY